MEAPTDKRYRSFLWSQTRKASYAETRLTVSEQAAPESKPQAAAPPAAEPANATPADPGLSRAKGKLTPLEQAAMRLSEHCLSPRLRAELNGEGATPPEPGIAPDYGRLHVQRCYAVSPDETVAQPTKLNVRSVS